MKAKVVRDSDGLLYGVLFACPGCTQEGRGMVRYHQVHVAMPGEKESSDVKQAPHWGFNGSFAAPTFTPSVLAWHPLFDDDDKPEKETGRYVCHSFVRDGRIQYLGDCSHALKGQTVDLPEVEHDAV